MPETFDSVQITEDLHVAGQVDLGNGSTGALSIGPGHVDVAGAPMGSELGFLLKTTSTPTPSAEGAILYFDGSEVRVMYPDGTDEPVTA